MKTSVLRAFLRMIGLLAIIVLVIVVQRPAMALRLKASQVIPHIWHKACSWLIGIETTVRGEQETRGPVLFVCNHVSYLDIPAIGSVINASFVAKAEIASWPVIGFLSRLQRTVYVERRARHAARHRDDLLARLEAGDSLILFPEGTSGDGTHVLPFKSTLFSVAAIEVDGRPLTVQPVSIAYTRLDRLPLGRWLRPVYAWYGDMSMAAHFWRVLGLGRIGVEITFHTPVTIADFGSRKALSEACHDVVSAGVAASLAGRRPALPAPRPESAAARAA